MSSTPSNVEVAIIGGGIGGLTTAVALHQMGIEAHVFEQAPAYGDVGGHLTMDTATIKVLERWNLDKPFLKVSCELAGIEPRLLRNGQALTFFPFPDLGALGVNDDSRSGTRIVYAFLRAEFLKLLISHIPESCLHTGYKLIELNGDADGANATFDNGTEVRAAMTLGADGVKSLARKQFDDSQAVSANWSVLRTLCSADLLPDDMPNDRMRFFDGWEFGDKEAGVAAHMLTVPVNGGKNVSIDLQFQGGDLLLDCDQKDLPVDRVMVRYPEGVMPLFRKMIENRLEPITSHMIFDRPVAEKWVDQKIAILGDAAHSMRPNLGQGASQSIHDAAALADAFEKFGLTTKALLSYEELRKPYLKSIVEAAKNQPIGPPKVKKP